MSSNQQNYVVDYLIEKILAKPNESFAMKLFLLANPEEKPTTTYKDYSIVNFGNFGISKRHQFVMHQLVRRLELVDHVEKSLIKKREHSGKTVAFELNLNTSDGLKTIKIDLNLVRSLKSEIKAQLFKIPVFLDKVYSILRTRKTVVSVSSNQINVYKVIPKVLDAMISAVKKIIPNISYNQAPSVYKKLTECDEEGVEVVPKSGNLKFPEAYEKIIKLICALIAKAQRNFNKNDGQDFSALTIALDENFIQKGETANECLDRLLPKKQSSNSLPTYKYENLVKFFEKLGGETTYLPSALSSLNKEQVENALTLIKNNNAVNSRVMFALYGMLGLSQDLSGKQYSGRKPLNSTILKALSVSQVLKNINKNKDSKDAGLIVSNKELTLLTPEDQRYFQDNGYVNDENYGYVQKNTLSIGAVIKQSKEIDVALTNDPNFQEATRILSFATKVYKISNASNLVKSKIEAAQVKSDQKKAASQQRL
jgi:hypothetical protein